MISIKTGVSVIGISTVVPPHELCLENDTTLYDGDAGKLKKVMKATGFSKRRVADDQTTAADLCEKAAQNLFAKMGVSPQTIDAVVFVSQTPDYHMPATSCRLQHQLGIPQSAAAFDVNQGCAGYTYGLWIAMSLASEACQNVLLLVGDTSSKFTDMFRKEGNAPIFGDAGSATIIRYTGKEEDAFYFDIGTDGSKYKAIIAENGAFRNIAQKDMFYEDGTFQYNASMDGLAVMEFTLDRVPASIENVLKAAACSKEDIDYFILHQANKLILKNIAMGLDVSEEKVPMGTLTKYGNLSCTSIPSAICDSIQSDISSRALNLCFSGFGIGLSWVSCVGRIGPITCTNIDTY